MLVKCFALCFLLVGGTSGTRGTSGTFDFQEENAGELRAWQMTWFSLENCFRKALDVRQSRALHSPVENCFRKALQVNFMKPLSHVSHASCTSHFAIASAKPKGFWEGQCPRCPIRRRTGNEDVAPPMRLNPVRSSLEMVWLNPARSFESKFQETIVPRVSRVPHVPLRYRQSAKRKASHCTATCKARSSTKWVCVLRVVEHLPLLFSIQLSKIKLAHSSATFQVRKHIFKASANHFVLCAVR